MLIIPAEHPLDWKRPPVITLLLILLNTLIYFGYQGGDEERREQAVQAYLDSGLLSRERPLFVDDLVRRDRLEADERDYVDGMRRQDLASAILHDLQFEQRLHQNPQYQADPAWQQARGRAEALRDRLSTPGLLGLRGLGGCGLSTPWLRGLLGCRVYAEGRRRRRNLRGGGGAIWELRPAPLWRRTVVVVLAHVWIPSKSVGSPHRRARRRSDAELVQMRVDPRRTRWAGAVTRSVGGTAAPSSPAREAPSMR